MDDEFKKKILELYSEYDVVHGPYTRKQDSRKICRLCIKCGKCTTRTLSKLTLEVNINRKLTENETCDHIDENKTNDHPDNLQVLSLSENIKKGHREGALYFPIASFENRYKPKGVLNCNNKLTEKQVKEIRSLGNEFDESKKQFIHSQQKIADMYNCSRENIKQILNYDTWVWLED